MQVGFRGWEFEFELEVEEALLSAGHFSRIAETNLQVKIACLRSCDPDYNTHRQLQANAAPNRQLPPVAPAACCLTMLLFLSLSNRSHSQLMVSAFWHLSSSHNN
jgi:hypothetical protein